MWTPEAKKQLGKLSFFVRPIAKRAIEKEAKEKGLSEITIDLMIEVKRKMGK
jgi:light-independent protochlorophyllide reductase subunit B